MPQNVVRTHFRVPDEVNRLVAAEILAFANQELSEETSTELATIIMQVLPSTLAGNIQPTIEIETGHGKGRCLVGISVPLVDLSKYPGGKLVQSAAGAPILYANVQYRVRVNRSARTVQYVDFALGFSQQPAWSKDGVQVEWRKTFKAK
jgi:hypothetical protein